jgi:membrane protein required for colicin V production
VTTDIGWVDIGMLAALVLSTLIGALRGLVFEILALAGWFVAYVLAGWLAPTLAPHIAVGVPGGSLNSAAAFAVGFFATLIVWSLVSHGIRRLVHATPLRIGDRMLGGVFGLARGLLLLLVLAAAVGFTPFASSALWQASAGAAALNEALHGLVPMLPSYLLPWLPAAVAT